MTVVEANKYEVLATVQEGLQTDEHGAFAQRLKEK